MGYFQKIKKKLKKIKKKQQNKYKTDLRMYAYRVQSEEDGLLATVVLLQ